jgi:formylglycine-generating enzyme required for sulfatase activity
MSWPPDPNLPPAEPETVDWQLMKATAATFPQGSLASARLRLEPGVTPIPGYELVRFLGRGNCGEAWEARGPGGYTVALKFLPLDEETTGAELSALTAMHQLRHPHLLSIFGSWQHQGYLILAMERADQTLYERLREYNGRGQSGVPRGELLAYIHEAAKGIDYLNGHGLVHRDVKPQNLFLCGGSVKVADFGLAKTIAGSVATASIRLTPGYAPPEILRQQITQWSDQYSLAVSYCHLRTGKLPFAGDLQRMLVGHLLQAPNLTGMSDTEQAVLRRALDKNPHQRWPNCLAMVDALARSASEHRTAASPRMPPSAHPAPLEAPFFQAEAGAAQLAWARHLNVPVERFIDLGQGVRLELILIPPGKFMMGSPPTEVDRRLDETQHAVTLTRPFYLGRYPVTQGQFRAVMGALPNVCASPGAAAAAPNDPVSNISWADAHAFCQALNVPGVVLPTEAMWEYACRAGTTTPFPFGDELNGVQANCHGHFPYGTTQAGPHMNGPTPVGSYAPNAFGLYDMCGNVWEWCQDYYGPYKALASLIDPCQHRSLDDDRRVVRGGSWFHRACYCRAAYRGRPRPDECNATFGFRLAASV